MSPPRGGSAERYTDMSDLTLEPLARRVERVEAAETTLEARSFRLCDARGNTRAELGLDEHGAPCLTLFDGRGNPRAALGLVGKQGQPRLSLSDADGNMRAALHLEDDERPCLALSDAGDTPRVLLYLGEYGPPSIALLDADGNTRAGLHLDTEGQPRLVMLDARGRMLHRAPERLPKTVPG